VTGVLRTPVNFIVHTLAEANDALAQGRYFFTDIAGDGIALYEIDRTELAQPRPKTPAEALALAKEYAEDWIPSAEQFLVQGREAAARGWSNKAAFEYHQAAERYYHGVLLVLTLYTPLCRARHKGVYAERRTMPMPNALPPAMRHLGELRAA
jgi:hypothetical protein